MADNKDNQPREEAEPDVESKAAGENGGSAGSADGGNGEARKGEGFADPLEFLNAELERAEGEKAELQDRMMRLAAEMENLRKRTAKDVADARDYSIASFAREMLGVSDNLRRALDAVTQETRDGAEESVKALIEGVELTERAMLQALEKGGVKRISPRNERFDPHFHQAMFEIANSEVPNNTVLEVVQDGYVIGERVLRPAMVGVAKGGPKQPAAEKAGEQAGQEADAQGEESPQQG